LTEKLRALMLFWQHQRPQFFIALPCHCERSEAIPLSIQNCALRSEAISLSTQNSALLGEAIPLSIQNSAL
jgi:hypothetical protein